MADHLRTQIRDAAVVLVSGLATTGTKVYPSRIWAESESNLPCLLVYTNDEDSEPGGMSRPRPLDRRCELLIEGLAQGTTATLDDLLDTIAKEIEAALGNQTFAGMAKDLWLSKTEKSFSAEGTKPTGAIKLTWICEYRTAENAADATV